jgi:hypothetical protein
MEFTCRRCGYETNLKTNLIRHLSKKQVCPSTNENVDREMYIAEITSKDYNRKTYDCKSCGKKFNNYQNRWAHKKICKGPEADNIRVTTHSPNANNTTMTSQSHNQSHSNNTNTNTHTNAHNTTSHTNAHNTNTTNNNTTNNNTTNNNTINIKINDFGQENKSYLSHDYLSMIFATRNVNNLFNNLHCDHEHPENHNVRVKSQKRKQMEVFEDGHWGVQDEDDTLEECIKQCYRILRNHGWKYKNDILKNELNDDEDEYDSIRSWLEKLHDDPKLQKPIKRKILHSLLNQKPT